MTSPRITWSSLPSEPSFGLLGSISGRSHHPSQGEGDTFEVWKGSFFSQFTSVDGLVHGLLPRAGMVLGMGAGHAAIGRGVALALGGATGLGPLLLTIGVSTLVMTGVSVAGNHLFGESDKSWLADYGIGLAYALPGALLGIPFAGALGNFLGASFVRKLGGELITELGQAGLAAGMNKGLVEVGLEKADMTFWERAVMELGEGMLSTGIGTGIGSPLGNGLSRLKDKYGYPDLGEPVEAAPIQREMALLDRLDERLGHWQANEDSFHKLNTLLDESVDQGKLLESLSLLDNHLHRFTPADLKYVVWLLQKKITSCEIRQQDNLIQDCLGLATLPHKSQRLRAASLVLAREAAGCWSDLQVRNPELSKRATRALISLSFDSGYPLLQANAVQSLMGDHLFMQHLVESEEALLAVSRFGNFNPSAPEVLVPCFSRDGGAFIARRYQDSPDYFLEIGRPFFIPYQLMMAGHVEPARHWMGFMRLYAESLISYTKEPCRSMTLIDSHIRGSIKELSGIIRTFAQLLVTRRSGLDGKYAAEIVTYLELAERLDKISILDFPEGGSGPPGGMGNYFYSGGWGSGGSSPIGEAAPYYQPKARSVSQSIGGGVQGAGGDSDDGRTFERPKRYLTAAEDTPPRFLDLSEILERDETLHQLEGLAAETAEEIRSIDGPLGAVERRSYELNLESVEAQLVCLEAALPHPTAFRSVKRMLENARLEISRRSGKNIPPEKKAAQPKIFELRIRRNHPKKEE